MPSTRRDVRQREVDLGERALGDMITHAQQAQETLAELRVLLEKNGWAR